MKTPRQFILEARQSGAVKQLVRQHNHLAAVLTDLKNEGRPPSYLVYVERAAADAMRADLIWAKREEVEALQVQIDAMGEEYEKAFSKNITAHMQALQLARDRYAAMDDDELTDEVVRYTGNPEDNRDPRSLDLLAAVMKSQPEEYAILREEMLKRDYRKPWIQSGDGKALRDEQRAWQEAKVGEFPVIIDGKAQVFDIGDLEVQDE